MAGTGFKLGKPVQVPPRRCSFYRSPQSSECFVCPTLPFGELGTENEDLRIAGQKLLHPGQCSSRHLWLIAVQFDPESFLQWTRVFRSELSGLPDELQRPFTKSGLLGRLEKRRQYICRQKTSFEKPWGAFDDLFKARKVGLGRDVARLDALFDFEEGRVVVITNIQ